MITARELMDRGLWRHACGLTGITPWAVSDGLMDEGYEVALTEDQAGKLGLLAARGSDPDLTETGL